MDLNGILIRRIYFPLMEIFKGNKIRTYLNYLHETEKMSAEELKRLQAEKLKGLLTHCLTRVPAYKEYEFLLDSVENAPFEVLTKLPVLTKKHFSENSELYFPEGQSKQGLIPNRTGGSTGEPVKFYMDRKTVEYYEAARWRGLSWWDIRPGDPSVMLWGSPIELSQKQRWSYELKERYLKNRIVISAYDLKESELERHVKLIEKFQPVYFYGYASALDLFAQMLLDRGITLQGKFKGVVSTAETLFDFQRERIERAFGCKTINEYGARDGGIIAYQCPEGSMHVTAENAVIELLDMDTLQPVKQGQSGLVAVTDLNNRVMPRLRYLIGDVAVWQKQPCECGRPLPVFTEIKGREDDIFVTTAGTYVHGHYFNHIARNLDGISKFQIIQKDRQRVHLKIVPGNNFNEEEIRFFAQKIREVMGNIELTVQYTDKIPAAASGKVRYAVREFPLR
ncbi:phenylacetate--CoA ligase [Thermincola ferriacetica]|uniref:Phenylacetate--CoA ligase n=1 Tax=Thermincola ferriacetica TaxID=281456 RepID=A0A0L6VY53_9FIRM|nr:phenylacetate--CoA ligase family protein [Thermincola ferriacetica]KNZ68262.1 phenylacetate--CoA ligase [Thermincola ferriacetica]